MDYKTIASVSFYAFCFELQEAFDDGWKLDEQESSAPYASFTHYSAYLIRDGNTVVPTQKKMGRPAKVQ